METAGGGGWGWLLPWEKDRNQGGREGLLRLFGSCSRGRGVERRSSGPKEAEGSRSWAEGAPCPDSHLSDGAGEKEPLAVAPTCLMRPSNGQAWGGRGLGRTGDFKQVRILSEGIGRPGQFSEDQPRAPPWTS